MYRTTEPLIKQFLIAPCKSNSAAGGGGRVAEKGKANKDMVD